MSERGIFVVNEHKEPVQADSVFWSQRGADFPKLLESRGAQACMDVEQGRTRFSINGAIISSFKCSLDDSFPAIFLIDRRVCSAVLRVDRGSIVNLGSLWVMSKLDGYKKEYFKDDAGMPFDLGIQANTHDLYGAEYEAEVHKIYTEGTKKFNLPSHLVPKVRGCRQDLEGPCLIVEHVQGIRARDVGFSQPWMMSGLLRDTLNCITLMWHTRVVHDDFYLRNFILCLDYENEFASGVMIDFDRVECFDRNTAGLNNALCSTFLSFLMEIMYIVSNTSHRQTAHPSCKDIISLFIYTVNPFKKNYRVENNGSILPDWDNWEVWYETEHECNDKYYQNKLQGTNLRYRHKKGPQEEFLPFPCIARDLWYLLAEFNRINHLF